jgi:hypothetical protein
VADVTKRIEYIGPSVGFFFLLLLQLLKEEGVVEVEYTLPVEERGVPDRPQQVVVIIVAKGAEVAIKAAVNQFRKRGGNAKIEDE